MKFPKIRKPRNNSSRHGVAAVEFAIIAPTLILILFFMIESSRYLTAVHATTGAAREAARLSAVTGADHATALTRAKDFMEKSGFTTGRVKLEVQSDQTKVPGMVSHTATVTIPFGDVSIVGDPFNLNVTLVRGDSAMVVPTE